MAASLRNGLAFTGPYEFGLETKESYNLGSSKAVAWKSDLKPNSLVTKEQTVSTEWKLKSHSNLSIQVKNPVCIPRGLKWWEINNTINMREIQSAQDLVDSLLNSGDKLVIVHFYSPGCGGCRALHPKITQLAELNTDKIFLRVNHEEHKSMCYTLGVHVLPFFRFYRGDQGKVCSFSCTINNIRKFKDALERYGKERCSVGPTKGLDESELVSLASKKELNSSYPGLAYPNDLTLYGNGVV